MQKRGGSGLELHSKAADQHLATADRRFEHPFALSLQTIFHNFFEAAISVSISATLIRLESWKEGYQYAQTHFFNHH
jgi:hypothetical protein